MSVELKPGQRFIFVFDQIPPGLNSSRNRKTGHPGGLLRMHWSKRAEILDAYIWHIKSQMPEVGLEPSEPPRIPHCNIFYTVRLVNQMDWDNTIASFKLLGDALKSGDGEKKRGAGVILDDSRAVVENFYPSFERVQHKEQQGCEVIIEVLPGDALGRKRYTLKHAQAQVAVLEAEIDELKERA